MSENIDIDSSGVILGERTVKGTEALLFEEVVEVAKGKLTAAEKLGHMELHLHIMYQKHVPCEC